MTASDVLKLIKEEQAKFADLHNAARRVKESPKTPKPDDNR